MPYVTIDGDVQPRMPQFQLTSTSKPSFTDASTFIADVEAEVDAALANLGYVTPITGEKSLAILKQWIAQGIIARILTARAAAVGGETAIASAERAQKLYDSYFTKLADADHPLELIDAIRTSVAVSKPQAVIMGSLYDESGNSLQPRVTMETKF